jgi:hypothetical protein
MKRPWFVPSGTAVLSASLLYGVLLALGAASAVIVPALLELMRTSPRLAMVGFLALTVSPAPAIAIVHRFGHGVLDAFDTDSTEELAAARGSAWAGIYGWLVLYGASVIATLVLLVIDPPRPEPESLNRFVSALVASSRSASPHAAVWIAIAAQLYEVELRQRRRRRRRADKDN